ncbi:MAG: hypothetical protein M1484_03025 [Patescibacteria group bacterium]|nr:hypothetical protein [Patescibacteria group bacterium]MCL5432045.1 hypothetical protein [Patescibacteria group bacterium]
MNLKTIITDFRKQQSNKVVADDQIEETLFIAFNVALSKTLENIGKITAEEELSKLSSQLQSSLKSENWAEMESTLNENLMEAGTSGILEDFSNNLSTFLGQLEESETKNAT